MSTVAIVVFCPHCDYFVKTAVQPGAVGSHACIGCDGPMEVYIAQGAKEVVQWHRDETLSPGDPGPIGTVRKERW